MSREVVDGTAGFQAEFRRRALDRVAAAKPVAEVARLLEVSDQSIYTWRRQELIDRAELSGFELVGAERAAGGQAADQGVSSAAEKCTSFRRRKVHHRSRL
jgi:transposase-like protein